MKLRLERNMFSEDSTIGDLFVDDVFQCFTLEDCDRKLENDGLKLYGETAIPRGTYQIEIRWSPHFNQNLPHLLNVPGFENILIHWGNASKDTLGCILVGKTKSTDFIGSSRAAFMALFDKITTAVNNGETTEIEVM